MFIHFRSGPCQIRILINCRRVILKIQAGTIIIMKSKLSRIYLRIHVEMKSWALLYSNLPSVIHWSNLSPSREAFHFYFYSNNDPTSPKGPRKQNRFSERRFSGKKKQLYNRLNGKAWRGLLQLGLVGK